MSGRLVHVCWQTQSLCCDHPHKVVTMELFKAFWCCESNTLLLVKRAVQTALMGCTSVDNWTMFKAPFTPMLILSHPYTSSSHKSGKDTHAVAALSPQRTFYHIKMTVQSLN